MPMKNSKMDEMMMQMFWMTIVVVMTNDLFVVSIHDPNSGIITNTWLITWTNKAKIPMNAG